MPTKRLAILSLSFLASMGLSLQAQVDLGGSGTSGTKQDTTGTGGSGTTSGSGSGTGGSGTTSGSGSGTSGSGTNTPPTGSGTSGGSGGTKSDVKGTSGSGGSTSGGGSSSGGSGTKTSGGSGNNPTASGAASGGSGGSSGGTSHTSSSSGGSGSNTPTSISPNWVTPWAKAVETATQNNRFLLVYIRPAKQERDPADFTVQDIIDSSRVDFVFFKQAYDPSAPEMTLFGVRRAPTLIGMDRFGNEFKRTDQTLLAEIRRILRETPDLVRKFVAKLQADFARAEEAALAGDTSRTLKLYLPIAVLNRKGYVEILKAREWVTAEGRERLRRIESIPERRTVRERLTELAALFKGTIPAAEAELRLARLDLEQGWIAAAIQRLSRLAKLDWVDAQEIAETAKTELDALISAGLKKVEAAFQIASLGNPASAKTALKKIQDDYPGTPVAEKAAEALQSIP